MNDEPTILEGEEGESMRFFYNNCFAFIQRMVKEDKGDERDASELFVTVFRAMQEEARPGLLLPEEKGVPYFIHLATGVWSRQNDPGSGGIRST